MTFGQAIKTVFKKYAVFEGTASRAEFWWWFLFTALVNLVLLFIFLISMGASLASSMDAYYYMDGNPFGMLMGLTGFGSLGLLYLVAYALVLPNLAVTVRRLRETGRKAWYLLVALVPVAGAITLVVMLAQPKKD